MDPQTTRRRLTADSSVVWRTNARFDSSKQDCTTPRHFLFLQMMPHTTFGEKWEVLTLFNPASEARANALFHIYLCIMYLKMRFIEFTKNVEPLKSHAAPALLWISIQLQTRGKVGDMTNPCVGNVLFCVREITFTMHIPNPNLLNANVGRKERKKSSVMFSEETPYCSVGRLQLWLSLSWRGSNLYSKWLHSDPHADIVLEDNKHMHWGQAACSMSAQVKLWM